MKTTPPDQTPRLPDVSNPSESALRKTFQKLLKKRSSKASKKLEKDLQRSSSKWQSYTQSSAHNVHPATDQPRLDDLLPPRQPRLSADTEEVASTLDALGWEQATIGGSVTAEYWQFVPHGDTLDLASLASQHGKDGSQTPMSGLQTPPNAFERRRTSTQLARTISQPSLADSHSPVDSVQPQPQSSTMSPHAYATHHQSYEQQQASNRPQHRSPASLPAKLQAMPRTTSDCSHHHPNSGWQHQNGQGSSHLQSSLFSASHRQQMSALTPRSQPEQQNLIQPVAQIQQNVPGDGIVAMPSTQRSGLVSQPPSATWTQNLPADASKGDQVPLDFSSLVISNSKESAGAAQESGRGNKFGAALHPASSHHAVSSFQPAMPRTQDGHHPPYDSQPPLGRAPSTPLAGRPPSYPLGRSTSHPLGRSPPNPLSRSPSHPLGRSPSYPSARTPSAATSGILSAAQLAGIHTNHHFPSKQLQSDVQQQESVGTMQQQNPAVQRPQKNKIMPSHERRQMPTNNTNTQTAEPWLTPSATPPPPAFHFPADPQSGHRLLPVQDIHRTEASLQDLPLSSSDRPSPRQPFRRKSFNLSAATTTPQHQPQATDPVARSNTSLTDSLSFAPAGGAFLGSPAPGSLLVGSDSQSGSKGSLRAGSTAASWVHSQSAQQLTANVKTLAAQVVGARSRQAQELAILKLYAVLSQAHFVKQQAEEWQGAFLGILALGFPLLLKHTAEIVIHQDKGYSDMVRKMAAGTLKSIARWMEGQLEGASPCRALVQQVLTQLVQEANQVGSRYAGAQGPTIHENEAWDSIMPTQQSFGFSETSGMGELLDSGTLDGMLDTDVTSIQHPGRTDHPQPRWGMMETGNGAGSSSIVDSEAWPEALQNRHPPPLTIRPPSILETGATCMALDTQDVADYARSHTKGLRLTFWLFKTDQEDAWYAAASLVGSMASLGEAHIDGMGGMKLVKPLFLVLRRGGNDCKAAALRALQHLTTERACRAMTARQDSYLQALVRAVQQPLTSLQYPATIILARLITNDPSTHYIVAEAGLIAALAKLLKQGEMPPEVREALSEALKHLTASSQKNRNTLVSLQVLPLVIAQLTTGEEGVQYNTARTLRHLALGSQPAHKLAALPAVIPLTQALQVGRPKVQFACASALAMLVEGHPEVCPQVLRHGGIAALTIMLQTAGAQGKKAAAEALQAVAAEDMDMKPRIAKSGAIGPLVGMVKSGNVQQQAAAAGALQALVYCPGRLDIAAGVAFEGGIPPLVHIVKTGPLPLRSAAAAALCNLALASPHNQAAIMRAGALPALTLLLEQAQPDGQYAAAAALYNLAGQDPEVRLALVTHGAVPPLVQMLQAESWYCRIVAAEVLGRVSMEWGNREAIEQGGAVDPLINLLRLNHSPGMLDSVEGPVHHLAYERGEDVIVMKGYKFAKAKTAAAATLGCLALANSGVASYLVQAGVVEQLMVMLESSSPEVRAVACACLGDLAAAHPPLQPYLSQRLSKLVRLVAGAKTGNAATGSCPDVAAAAAAIGLLVAQQSAARAGLLQLRGLKPLLTLLHQGTLAEQSVAANVLFDMIQGSEEAARLLQGQGGPGVVERVHALVASTDTPAAAAGGGTAALLHNTSLLAYAGFAMTAKPSVNLLILLQIPFEELAGGRSSSQPHTLVPANLLLTTVQSLAPSTGQAPLSTQHHSPHSPLSSGGETDQEDELDAALGPLQPIYPTSNSPYTSGSHALQSSLSQTSAPGRAGSRAARQEQFTHPTASQFHQQTVQQHILDTFLG